jgi:hypothetical protein
VIVIDRAVSFPSRAPQIHQHVNIAFLSSFLEITKSPPTRHASGRKLADGDQPDASMRARTSVSLSSKTARVEVAFAPDGRNAALSFPSTPGGSDFSFPDFHASAHIYFTLPQGDDFCTVAVSTFSSKEITEMCIAFRSTRKAKPAIS